MAGLTGPRVEMSAGGAAGPMRVRRRLRVRGIVQGVGFRPFVYNLALEHGLAGFVGNDSGGVFIEIEGPVAGVVAMQDALLNRPPPLAHIEAVEVAEMALQGERGFAVVESTVDRTAGAEHTFVSPDQALCADCRRELFDPGNRRYLYPFINCTNCGPRYTIIKSTPYDRAATTMAGFTLCADCRREYEDPSNRRFHAQPNACPVCGPRLALHWSQANPEWGGQLAQELIAQESGEPATEQLALLRLVQAVLAGGGIAAIKGIGGFHLACDATNAAAVGLLRARKSRPAKPFAVMAADVASVRRIAHVDDAELRLLNDRARPIVLLRKRADSPLAPEVAPGNGYVGVMLPYSPLHELLFHALPGAAQPQYPPQVLVMTSGNLADEPIVFENTAALERLDALADVLLLHDRDIYAPCDDSVVRIFQGAELPVRRSRGYAPFPVALAGNLPPILAVGGELKSTFCLAQGRHALLSPHIGDLASMSTLAAFDRKVRHMSGLFRITPEIIACDMHPGYLSTAWAKEHADGRPVVTVQHHHAHVAAVMAEHGVDMAADGEAVIGFSFDGTGYGTDGTIWGGEVLLATYRSFTRAGHLRYTPLPGGDTAIKRPYRVALAQLWAAGEAWDAALPPVAACSPTERGVLLHQVKTGLNTLPTSSMGRLCDAVAALAGVRQVVDYEAQAAIELEALAGGATGDAMQGYHFAIEDGNGVLVFDAAPVIRAVAADVHAGVAPGLIAVRFHVGLAALIVELAMRLRARTGIGRVALSGGVFQNVTLLADAVRSLEGAGFVVLTHRRVPPNDGGLALGQAVSGGVGPG